MLGDMIFEVFVEVMGDYFLGLTSIETMMTSSGGGGSTFLVIFRPQGELSPTHLLVPSLHYVLLSQTLPKVGLRSRILVLADPENTSEMSSRDGDTPPLILKVLRHPRLVLDTLILAGCPPLRGQFLTPLQTGPNIGERSHIGPPTPPNILPESHIGFSPASELHMDVDRHSRPVANLPSTPLAPKSYYGPSPLQTGLNLIWEAAVPGVAAADIPGEDYSRSFDAGAP